jgi:hypothetical protein
VGHTSSRIVIQEAEIQGLSRNATSQKFLLFLLFIISFINSTKFLARRGPKNQFFQIFQTSNHQKDYKPLKFRNCPKTGQLNCLHNHLIYKAFPKTRKASSILASPFNPLTYKA